jgi:hypothetical protein
MGDGALEDVDPTGTTYVGLISLRFNLRYDGWRFLERVIRDYRREKGLPEAPASTPDGAWAGTYLGEGLKEADRSIIGARYADALRKELEAEQDEFRLGIPDNPPNIDIEGSGIRCMGPGGDLLTLYGIVFTGAEQLVVWASLCLGVRALMRRLAELTDQPVELDTGSAVIVAADEILRETGERDLVLAFSTEVSPFEPNLSCDVDGFAVGFRERASIRVALMDRQGEHVIVRLMPMPSVEE